MLLRPKNQKYKKSQKGRLKSKSRPVANLEFGNFGLVSTKPFKITASHIESCRLGVRRIIKREGKVLFRVFPHIPVTKKPSEVRMGKGKGSVEYFMSRVPANTVVLEIDYPGNPLIGLQALKVASQILPVKTSILERFTPRIIRYDN